MKLTSLLPLLAVLCGCSTIYERAAHDLINARGRIGSYFSGSWVRSETRFDLSEEEKDKRDTALATCIAELNVRIAGPHGQSSPNKALATAQLIACMRSSGWLYTIHEIVTAN